MTPSQRTLSLLWQMLLVVLPVSSFPLLSRIFGGTSVAPLAFLPMAVILIFWWTPSFIKNGRRLPYQVKPLIIFLLFGLISTLLANFHFVPTFRDIPWLRNSAEVLVTFAMGLGFYLVTIFMVNNPAKLRTALMWISIGGIALIAVSWIQYGTWLAFERYPDWMYRVQSVITANGRLYPARASGLAYEPSWLAHELNMVYIPIWFGLSLSGQSVFKKKLFNKIQFEKVFFLLAVATLFISFSRIGWITMIILAAYAIFRMTNNWINGIYQKRNTQVSPVKQGLFRFGIWSALLFGLLAVLLLAGFIMTKIEPRMAGLFDIQRFIDFGFLGWASKLSFAERIIYWMAAYNVFLMYPMLGAGFGIPGYYFPLTAPNFGTRLPEINKVVLSQNFIPNAKNLWVRLLSETGIIGFALFVSWVLIHWRNAHELERRSTDGLLKAMGLVGKLIVLAMVIEGFSLDTFGLPYYWVGLGLISASWLINDQESAKTGANIEVTNDIKA
ncbi:MAG: O-antigen ligase family protein [Chloroflexi bacterium]|nr:O-antigen ligase family protein [Chloroflexota bacterium]